MSSFITSCCSLCCLVCGAELVIKFKVKYVTLTHTHDYVNFTNDYNCICLYICKIRMFSNIFLVIFLCVRILVCEWCQLRCWSGYLNLSWEHSFDMQKSHRLVISCDYLITVMKSIVTLLGQFQQSDMHLSPITFPKILPNTADTAFITTSGYGRNASDKDIFSATTCLKD